MLGVALVSNVSGIRSLDAFERLTNSNQTILTVRNRDSVKVLTVRTSDFDPAGQGGSAKIEAVDAVIHPGTTPSWEVRGIRRQPELLVA